MNPPSPQPGDEAPGATPGKIRTWWHPLLANLLRWQLGSHYHLFEEVPVGQKPLQIDILLLLKEQGELPASARQILAGLVEYLNDFTLLEFKSPSDTLRAGDFQTFMAYVQLYRAQNNPLLNPGLLHLLVVAPKLTKPYHEELRTFGVSAELQKRGIWCLQGGPVVHRTWVLETEELAGLEHPLLTLVSPKLLQDRLTTYEMLRLGGYTDVVVYMAQQICQFRLLGKEFAMQHLGTEDEMQQALRDLLASLPPEELLQGLQRRGNDDQRRQAMREMLATMPPRERLEGLSPDERLEGISAEDLVRELSPEKLERLRQLLRAQPKAEPPSHPE